MGICDQEKLPKAEIRRRAGWTPFDMQVLKTTATKPHQVFREWTRVPRISLRHRPLPTEQRTPISALRYGRVQLVRAPPPPLRNAVHTQFPLIFSQVHHPT